MSRPSLTSSRLLDVIDIVDRARSLNQAMLMAAGGDGVTREAAAALQAVADEINDKLLTLGNLLEEIGEDLA